MRGWRWALGAVALAILTACAVQEPTPLLREDFARLRTDLARIEQAIQRSQAEIKADLQRVDRQSAQTLTEIQRSIAQLGTRLDDLGRDAAQLQGRVDELRRRVDMLALQFEVAGPPPAGAGPAARPAPGPAPPAEAGRPTPPPTPPGPTAPGSAPPSALAPPPGAARQAADLYQTAYLDYTRGNYNLAIAGFKEFIRLYPETDLAEKAQYWIGESHYSLARGLRTRGDRARATQEFERAVQEFRRVLVNYPRGDRVATALYKEALALLELQQPALAEARLQFLVDQFPSTEEAAKAKEELAKLRRP
ncbi:MAG: outer membrane protein assembly factor BamD [Candidatus Rokubacteria bacterium]|nr:outer membrane protein assembly factor BamD [Candidatus Rokubacteria bacterium]